MSRSTGNEMLQVSRACKTTLFLLFIDQCGKKKGLAPVPGTRETQYSLTSYHNRDFALRARILKRVIFRIYQSVLRG